MKTKWIITMGMLLAAATSAGWGQEYEPLRPAYHLQPIDGGYYGGYYGTYEGSVASGMGAFARGVGEYNYLTAQAAREFQEARALAIQNHQTAVANWLSRRAAHRERVRAEMLTPEQVVRVVEASRPARLTAAEYQAASGKLAWPAALLGEEFATGRAVLDKLFAGRTSQDSGAASVFYATVRQETDRMMTDLKEKLHELSPMEFIAAKRFLVGVKYEALSPAVTNALAMSG